ncbi:MAG TPA: hypothetical protein PKM59_06925 [Thermodesulfobacteriota bacterium]|nr:hypothetical protein [Thermodesulfobacteriota bacterium]
MMSAESSGSAVNGQLLHDLIIHAVKEKYAMIHKTVYINPGQEKNFDIQGIFPDIVFGGYGQIVQIVEVETDSTLTKDRTAHWEKLAGLGVPFAILVAKKNQRLVTDLLWKSGLMAKAKVATFDIVFEKL